MRKKLTLLIALASTVAVSSTFVAPAWAQSPNDILVIGNAHGPVSEIDIKELKTLFLKKKLYWKTGVGAIVINSKDGSKLRQEFQRRVLKMKPAMERIYWMKHKIESAKSPPIEFANTQKAVFKLINSVSYVFRRDHQGKVNKVLLVVPIE